MAPTAGGVPLNQFEIPVAYLRHRADRGRDGTLGAAHLPPEIVVLVVDDGSTDGTAALVRARPEFGQRLPEGIRLDLLQIPHGGKGAAVRAGMLAATGEAAVFADADMATPPDQLPRLVAALADHDVALGSRIQPDGSDMRRTQPAFRRFLGKAFHLLASAWAVGPIVDTQCGFKGFTSEAAADLFGRQRITSIVFDAELIHLARRRPCVGRRMTRTSPATVRPATRRPKRQRSSALTRPRLKPCAG